MEFEIYELTNEQNRLVIDIEQTYKGYIDTLRLAYKYRGNMRWTKARGKEYLVRGMGSKGYGKSLGLRTDKTEKIYNTFKKEKKYINNRLSKLKKKITELARYAKAARIQRFPITPARVLRHIEKINVINENIIISGTNCLYAYEAQAGVRLESELLSTQDIDILWDTRNSIKIVSDDSISNKGFIEILQRADRSFAIDSKNKYRAINDAGYMVELITPIGDIRSKRVEISGYPKDMTATEIKGLEWLVSSPKISQIVIDEKGMPAVIKTVIPTAFVLHKLWLSHREDRIKAKRQRDRDQAITVAKLIVKYLPQYKFTAKKLKSFPEKIYKQGIKQLKLNGVRV